MTELLKVFKTATTLLSGVYYPTSHWVLKQLYIITTKLNEFAYEGEIFENMAEPMKEKLRKYFSEMPPVITCSAAMNPCVNVCGVELMIHNICHNLDLNERKPMFEFDMKKAFKSDLQDLFAYYFEKYGASTMVSSSTQHSMFPSSSSQNVMLNLYNSLREENVKRARGDGNQTASSEYGRYSGTDYLSTVPLDEFETFDILAWWKDRESQFPVLAIMARDLLTVQASTVASESAFSLSGRVLSIRRTRLTPASLEMCICLKDHLDAAERVQHVSSLEGETEFEEDIHNIEVEEGITISLSDEEIALDQASQASREEEDFDF